MNNTDEILKLMKALTELPFETMEVSTQELTVRVSRGGVSLTPAAAQAPAAKAEKPAGAPRSEPGGKAVQVASPIIGVFYTAPSPEDAPYVRVGERVRAGQTLCIVEAMKLMNEIPSPVDGTVVEVLASDGGEVEVGQALFLVEASED
jgi:acetyl-CoA carboxylase biotin carboxyl carrier protein